MCRRWVLAQDFKNRVHSQDRLRCTNSHYGYAKVSTKSIYERCPSIDNRYDSRLWFATGCLDFHKFHTSKKQFSTLITLIKWLLLNFNKCLKLELRHFYSGAMIWHQIGHLLCLLKHEWFRWTEKYYYNQIYEKPFTENSVENSLRMILKFWFYPFRSRIW